MEDWVRRALQRWPDVPALFGWLGLDRRGRWLIRGETISRQQIIDTIAANYAADDAGRWYFQNGPQRGYVSLAYAPYVLHSDGDQLRLHTGAAAGNPTAAYIDEQGSILLQTAAGPALLSDIDLDWASARLSASAASGAVDLDESTLAAALALPSGASTGLYLNVAGNGSGNGAANGAGHDALPLIRLDSADAPAALGFVRDPQPVPIP